MATPINTLCLSAPNTTGNSPTSTAGPRIRREASRAWEMQASDRRTCLGNEVGEIGVWEKRVIGKIFMLPCAGFWVILTVVFCLRYFRPSESIGLTVFLFFWDGKTWMHLRKRALGKEKTWAFSIQKNPKILPKVPNKNQPNPFLAQGLEAEIETKEPEKDYNSWQHKAGGFFVLSSGVLFLHSFTASGGFFAI